MRMEVIKRPLTENDDALFKIYDFHMLYSQLCEILDTNPYMKTKFNKFKDKDVTIKGFDLDRPSFRHIKNLDSIDDALNPQLNGSIYTHSVKDRNSISYEECLTTIKRILIINPPSRKAVIRMANTVTEYESAETDAYDVSCLSMIHYLNNPLQEVRLVFRASDIKNELLTDLVTIYWFFIKPIFDKADITVYASTAQYVDCTEWLVHTINDLGEKWKKVKS